MASNEEAVREERLLYLQLQDLGLERRDEIITSETEANSFFLEDDQLQSRRRNNRDGTIESKAIKGKEDVLSAWNTAWTTLKDDGTAEEDLEDVGTGIGQSHRHKLLEDTSVQQYSDEPGLRGVFRDSSRGGFSNRGDTIGRGNFKGQIVRFAEERTPVTRKRVPKGQSAPTLVPIIKVTPVTVSANNDKRLKYKNIAFQAKESFQRQERHYGSGINLTNPETFMATIHRITSTQADSNSANPSNHAPTPLPQTATIKVAKPSSVFDTSGVAKAIAKYRSPVIVSQVKSATNSARSKTKEEPLMPTAARTKAQDIFCPQANSQGFRLGVLPKLRELLNPEHYSILEDISANQSRSLPMPASSSTDVLTTTAPAETLDAQQFPSSITPQQQLSLSPASISHIHFKNANVDVSTPPPVEGVVDFHHLSSQPILPQQKVASPKSNSPTTIDKADMDKLFKDALSKRLRLWVHIKSPEFFKCLISDCTKAFKSQNTWEKHVEKRHLQWLQKLNDNVVEDTRNMVDVGAQKENIFVTSEVQAGRFPTEMENKPLRVIGAKTPTNISTSRPETNTTQASTVESSQMSSPHMENGAQAVTIESLMTTLPDKIAPSMRASRRSLALSLARQRDAIIGEHIIKTRFLPASLSERFQNLGIASVAPALASKTSNQSPNATKNPFGQPKPATTTRASGPAIPDFLAEATFSTDPGAAARAQYGGTSNVAEPSKQPLRNPMTPKIGQELLAPAKSSVPLCQRITSTQVSGCSSISPAPLSQRVTPARGTGPSLPAFLQGAAASPDLGEGARLQYGTNIGKRGADPVEVARKRGL